LAGRLRYAPAGRSEVPRGISHVGAGARCARNESAREDPRASSSAVLRSDRERARRRGETRLPRQCRLGARSADALTSCLDEALVGLVEHRRCAFGHQLSGDEHQRVVDREGVLQIIGYLVAEVGAAQEIAIGLRHRVIYNDVQVGELRRSPLNSRTGLDLDEDLAAGASARVVHRDHQPVRLAAKRVVRFVREPLMQIVEADLSIGWTAREPCSRRRHLLPRSLITIASSVLIRSGGRCGPMLRITLDGAQPCDWNSPRSALLYSSHTVQLPPMARWTTSPSRNITRVR